MTPPNMYPIHLFHPDFKNLDMWFPAKDAWVLEYLCRKLRAERGGLLKIMEIGSYAGGSATIFSPHSYSLLCVDTWAGSGKDHDEMRQFYDDFPDVLETFLRNMSLLTGPRAAHRRTLNPDSLPDYLLRRRQKFDLIFIDGGHDYDSVKADIAIAEQWIDKGGIICGHDLGKFSGVNRAVQELEGVSACGTVWWVTR